MAKQIIRVVSRAGDGELKTKEYEDFTELLQRHDQIGLDDCSTDLSFRGLPLFRGLVGPIPEANKVILYESPDVFEAMTKEWSQRKTKRKRRTREELENSLKEASEREASQSPSLPTVPFPKFSLGLGTASTPTVNS
jgi:hypothetical protein